MKLDDYGEIWGVDLDSAKEYGSLRRITNLVILLACAVVIMSVVSIMKSAHVSYGNYLQTMILLAAISFAIYGLCVRNKLYKVYSFYHQYRKVELRHTIIRVSAQDIYNILYKATKVRLKEDDTIENYISLANATCCADRAFAKYLIKSLLQLNSNDGTSIEVYYVEKRFSKGYVAMKPFVSDEKSM